MFFALLSSPTFPERPLSACSCAISDRSSCNICGEKLWEINYVFFFCLVFANDILLRQFIKQIRRISNSSSVPSRIRSCSLLWKNIISLNLFSIILLATNEKTCWVFRFVLSVKGEFFVSILNLVEFLEREQFLFWRDSLSNEHRIEIEWRTCAHFSVCVFMAKVLDVQVGICRIFVTISKSLQFLPSFENF